MDDGIVTGEVAEGAGLGEGVWWGWNGHGNDGEDDTTPPEEGTGAATGGKMELSGGDAVSVGDTFTANFSEAWHVLRVPFMLKVK